MGSKVAMPQLHPATPSSVAVITAYLQTLRGGIGSDPFSTEGDRARMQGLPSNSNHVPRADVTFAGAFKLCLSRNV